MNNGMARVRFCEGLRTPAPVCAAPPSWGRHPQTFTGTEVATTFMCIHYRWPRYVDDRSRSIRQEPMQGQAPTQFPLQLTEFLRVACSSSYLNPKLYQ